jgi:hypothetical protein
MRKVLSEDAVRRNLGKIDEGQYWTSRTHRAVL